MILDLFAGPGGWDEGLKQLGITENIIGFEWDPKTAATAEAAGHSRVVGDVRDINPSDYSATGLIASPPCQTFSAAGNGHGRPLIAQLAEALTVIAAGATVIEATERTGLNDVDPRSPLILEPMRFIRDLGPDWITFEETPGALPIFDAYSQILTRAGYSTWAGVLNAANYGIPQTRKRAFLIATRTQQASPPPPSHARHPEPDVLFDARSPWVTMAQALRWNAEDCRAANLRAPEPAHDPERALWPLNRPATTVVRSFRPDVIAAPGYRQAGDGPRQNARGSVSVTPEQMLTLQGARADYPIAAEGAKRLSIIGAILPPPWAAAVLAPHVTTPPAARDLIAAVAESLGGAA